MLDTILETGDSSVSKKSLLYADFCLLEGANYSMLFASSPSVFVGQIELYIHKIKGNSFEWKLSSSPVVLYTVLNMPLHIL